jgi:hypothetical protein
MVHNVLTAPTLEELTEKVQQYGRKYHPSGYGTSFYWHSEHVDPITGRNLEHYVSLLSLATTLVFTRERDENGNFVIHTRHATHCD